MNFWLFAQAQVLGLSESTRALFWRIQAYGLILLTFLSFFPRLFHLEEYLFFSLLTIALIAAWLDGKVIWIRTPIDLPLLLFVSWVLFTIPFAIDPAYSFSEWRKLVAQVLVFYWAAVVLRAQDLKAVRYGVAAAVVIGTAALCAYALTDFVTRGGTWRDRYVQAVAPSSDYNWLGTYLVMALPLVVVSAHAAVHQRWVRLVCWGVTTVAMVALVLSYNRAAWLGLVAQGVMLGLVSGHRWLMRATLVVCLGGAVGLIAFAQAGYQQQTISADNMSYRLVLWEKSLQEIANHPLLGVGYGNDTFPKKYGVHPVTGAPAGPHSLFLMIALGSGLPALGFFVWTLARSVISLVRGTNIGLMRANHFLMLGVAIMIVGFAVRNLFDYMFAGSIAYLFWILIAVGLIQLRTSPQPNPLLETTNR